MKTSHHISTKNYIPISRQYMTDIVRPSLDEQIRHGKPVIKTCLIAGNKISLNFYNEEMYKKLFPALSHLEINDINSPDLSIHIWDGQGTKLLSPLLKREHSYERESHTKKEISEDFLGAYLFGENTLNLYDRSRTQAFFYAPDTKLLPNWVAASPFRTILNWYLSDKKISLVHGAVVGLNNKAVLLAAKGGSGKSTTALACIMSGMDYISDDYAAVEIKNNQAIAYSLYNTVKIVPDMWKYFPEFEKNWSSPDAQGKSVMFLSKLMPQRIVASLPLSAILIPRMGSQKHTTIEPIRKIEALSALIPTTLFQLPLAREDAARELKQIVQNTPCYTIVLGEVRFVSDGIKKFLNEVISS